MMERTSVATDKEEKIRVKKSFSNRTSCFKICNRFKFKKIKIRGDAKSEEPINITNHSHSSIAAFGDCVRIRNSLSASSNGSSQNVDQCCFIATLLRSLKSSLSGKHRSETDGQSPDSDEVTSSSTKEPAVNGSSCETPNARARTATKVQNQLTVDAVDIKNGGISRSSVAGRDLSSKTTTFSAAISNSISHPVKLAAGSESRTNGSSENRTNRDDKEQLPLKGEVYFFTDGNAGVEKFNRKGRIIGNNNNGNKKFRKLDVNSGNKNGNRNKSSELFRNNGNNGGKQSNNRMANRLPAKRPKRGPTSNDRMTGQQSKKTAIAEAIVDIGGNCRVGKDNRATANRDDKPAEDIDNPIVTNKDDGRQFDCAAAIDLDSERRRSSSDDKALAYRRAAAIVSRIPIWKRRCPIRYCGKPEMKSAEVQTSTVAVAYEWKTETGTLCRALDAPQPAQAGSPSADIVAGLHCDRSTRNSTTYTELPRSRVDLSSSRRSSLKSDAVNDRSAKSTRHDLDGGSTALAEWKEDRSLPDGGAWNVDDRVVFDKCESLQILTEDFLKDNVDQDDFLAASLPKMAASSAPDPLLLASYRCDSGRTIADISTAFGEFQQLGLPEKIRLLQQLVNRALEEIPELAGDAAAEKDELPAEVALPSERRHGEPESGSRSIKPEPEDDRQTTERTTKTLLKRCRTAGSGSRIPKLRYRSVEPALTGQMFLPDSRNRLKATSAKLSVSVPSLSSSCADFHIQSVISEITVNSNTNTPLKYLTPYANVQDSLADVSSLKSEVPLAFDAVPLSGCRCTETSVVIDGKDENEQRANPPLPELQQFTLHEATNRPEQTGKDDENAAVPSDRSRFSSDDGNGTGGRLSTEIDFV